MFSNKKSLGLSKFLDFLDNKHPAYDSERSLLACIYVQTNAYISLVFRPVCITNILVFKSRLNVFSLREKG